jgi:MFS transporter, ACS family, hexuronate transporter
MPRRATASVVGIGGMAGAIGGMLMAKYVGGVLEDVGNYTPIFLLIGSIYLIALLVIHLISPRLEPAKID